MGHSKRVRKVDKKSLLSLIIANCLFFSMLSTVWVQPAQAAKTSRAAIVTEVNGNVTVKKAGGSKAYTVYADMSLNQGDVILTGAQSSAVLKIADHEDEITIGDNAEVNISELSEQAGGKQSKLKTFAGSIWVKVKSLVSSEDEFEVETPTAVMGVRGTQLGTFINPATGQTGTYLASGRISASTSTNGTDGSRQETTTDLLPSQQLTLSGRYETERLNKKVGPFDIDDLIANAAPRVIEAIIRNKAEIDKENAQFIEKMKQQISDNGNANTGKSPYVIKNNETLDKIGRNLDNLIGNIAKAALEHQKFSKEQMDKIINETNLNIADPAKKLDLNNVQQLDPTAGLDPLAEQQRLAEIARWKMEEQEKYAQEFRAQQELLERLKAILDLMEREVQRINDLNKTNEEEAKKRLEAEYISKLNDDEKKRFQQDKEKKNSQSTPSAPSPSGGGSGGSSGGGGTSNTNVPAPVLSSSPAIVTAGNEELRLRGVSNTNIQLLLGDKIIASLPGKGFDQDTVFTKAEIKEFSVNGEYNLIARAERGGRFSPLLSIPKITVSLTEPSVKQPELLLSQSGKEGNTVLLNLSMANFPQDKQFYAVEAHLVYDKSLSYNGPAELSDVPGTVFDGESKSAETLRQVTGSTQNELIYAASQFEASGSTTTVPNITVEGAKTLVTVPLTFSAAAAGSAKVDLVYVKVVNKNGATVAEFTAPKSITVTK
ncbi:FecR domain-containing protein [Paenibacillus piri]|uniref:FecR protein domain-containing protein n=1 Tax=Paenibacillus piri TaxID=2547395 RepID=A0A4R5KL25_9BACL|nr:FecR domain-containing protein [Paenibacillus piri]TDF95872.1 hypothetical protein E1757_19300 [Paenibacillus piri]